MAIDYETPEGPATGELVLIGEGRVVWNVLNPRELAYAALALPDGAVLYIRSLRLDTLRLPEDQEAFEIDILVVRKEG